MPADDTVLVRLRFVAGILVAGVLVYMSFLTLQQDFDLQTPVLVGMLSLVVVLLYGTRELERLIGAARGADYRHDSYRDRVQRRDAELDRDERDQDGGRD